MAMHHRTIKAKHEARMKQRLEEERLRGLDVKAWELVRLLAVQRFSSISWENPVDTLIVAARKLLAEKEGAK